MLVNLTENVVQVKNEEGNVVTVKPDGKNIRVMTFTSAITKHDGISIHNVVEDRLEGIPEPSDDIMYIVDKEVAKSLVTVQGNYRGDILYYEGGDILKRFLA